jgi:hypothetical protein
MTSIIKFVGALLVLVAIGAGGYYIGKHSSPSFPETLHGEEKAATLNAGTFALFGLPDGTYTGYAKDKNGVYFNNVGGCIVSGTFCKVDGADLQTFEITGPSCTTVDCSDAKDKNHVYNNGSIVR